VRIQQVSAWAHVPDTPGLQLKCPAAVTWRRDVERYMTDLVLGVAEPVVAIREGFFAFLEMKKL
jgi:hypothetical protein